MKHFHTYANIALFLVLYTLLMGCPPPPSACDASRFKDDEEPATASMDSCAKAEKVICSLGCEECENHRFAVKCRDLAMKGVPICPVKLSKIKSCDEIDEVCQ